MPSFITARFLIAVIIAGSSLALTLMLVAVAGRILREAADARRARIERRVRPMVLAVVGGETVPPELISVRGRRGRAAERVIFVRRHRQFSVTAENSLCSCGQWPAKRKRTSPISRDCGEIGRASCRERG